VRSLQVQQVSIWNSPCAPPVPLQRIQRRSTGGTLLESVFQPVCHVPHRASCFVFMTGGQVGDTTQLASHASVTSHLPSLFFLFRYSSDHARELVSSYNVSFVMEHHTAARTSDNLEAMEGDWETALPLPPPLTNDLLVSQCPTVAVEHLRTLPSRVSSKGCHGDHSPLSPLRTMTYN
jgi:hypothetical protein